MRRIWELFGSYLAAIWELSESQQGYLGSQGALSHLGSYFVENWRKNAKVPLKCQFYDVFLRVGVTKHRKLHSKMLRGSRRRIQPGSKAP